MNSEKLHGNLKKQSYEVFEDFGRRIFKNIVSRFYLRWQSIFSSLYNNGYFFLATNSTPFKNRINEKLFNEENNRIQYHEFNFNYYTGQTNVLLQNEVKEDLYFEFVNHNNTFLQGLFSNPLIKSNVSDKSFDEVSNTFAKTVLDENETNITHQTKCKRKENVVLRKEKEKLKSDIKYESECFKNDMKSCVVLLNKLQFVSQDTNLDQSQSVKHMNETFDDFLNLKRKLQINNHPTAIKAHLPPTFEDFIKSSKKDHSTVFILPENEMLSNSYDVTTNKISIHSINYTGKSKLVERNTSKQDIVQNSNFKPTQEVSVNSKSDVSRYHRMKRKLGESDTSLNVSEANGKSSKRAKRLKVNSNSINTKCNEKHSDEIPESNSSLSLSLRLDTSSPNGENYPLMYEKNCEAGCNTRLKLSTTKSKRYRSVTVPKQLLEEGQRLDKSVAGSQIPLQGHIRDFHLFRSYLHSNNKHLNEHWETRVQSSFTFQKSQCGQLSPFHLRHRLYTVKDGVIEIATVDDLLLKSRQKSIKKSFNVCEELKMTR